MRDVVNAARSNLIFSLFLGAPVAFLCWIFKNKADVIVKDYRGVSAPFLWAICGMLLLVLVTGFCLAIVLLNRARWRYRSDDFFGVHWTWSYDLRGKVCGIAASCPSCGHALSLPAEPALNYDNLLCATCGYDSLLNGKENFPHRYDKKVTLKIEDSLTARKYGIRIDRSTR
jgi:hypothetical protein